MLKSHEKFHSINGKRLILVVDDEEVNQELLGFILQNDYEVLNAYNGTQALEIIRENEDRLSLILLDLLMPEMSGMELLAILKDDEQLKNIPVIVMTSDQKSEVECLNMGAMDFISKPYPQPSVILARIVRSIELNEDRQIINTTERDPLTGLYNREYFYRYAEQYDTYHKDTEMDAIVIDINHFHLINERYGKIFGDELLRRISIKLREILSACNGIVCRREADTFLIHCPHRGSYDDFLKEVTEDLHEDDTVDVSSRIRLRMGVYSKVDKSIDIERRFDRAKLAADTVRNNYTKKYAVYDSELHNNELYAEQLAEDFSTALKQRQFKVYYQPKFDIRSDAPFLSSAEALVRWEHPEFGLVSPGVFIPIFEENGLIRQLDNYVWREAARQVAAWKEEYGFYVPVSVNVSRIDIFDEHFVENIVDIVERAGISPEVFYLEITESAYTDDSEHIVSTVNRLRSIGFSIEMDDFGTGYSSLGMISNLPIDALKLDMTFVRNAFRETNNLRMIEIIMSIAEHLNVPVIAEGVETQAQMFALKSLGCDIVQGYYFSKPLPADEFNHFIKEHAGNRKLRTPDDIKLTRFEELEKNLDMAQIESQNVTYARIAQSLAADYFCIYYVDLETDEFYEFNSDDKYSALNIEKAGTDFFNLSRINAQRLIYKEDLGGFLEIFKKENVLLGIQKNGAFTLTYRLMLNGEPNYVRMKASSMDDNDIRHIVIGINNVQNEMNNRKDILTYSNIAQALAADYFSIYYVNSETDRFKEFSSHASYSNFELETEGDNFFELSRKNSLRVIHPEDQKRFLQQFTKNNILQSLDKNGTFTLIYRLLFSGVPMYVNMKASRMTDGKHLVFGINNIDAQMKRQQELELSREKAIRDPLTGVKSSLVFSEREIEMNNLIHSDSISAFSIVVCDINNMYDINGLYGRNIGDRYIKDASTIICNVFKHSPVFRVGGDEFVVILQGRDYSNRRYLMQVLEAENLAHKNTGGVVIASGMADYKHGTDLSFSNVLDRAEAAMRDAKDDMKK